MKNWSKVKFSELIVESKDGEWGIGSESPGHKYCTLIRGTDFEKLNQPNIQLPHRWIKNHLVDRKRLSEFDVIFEMAGGTATQSTGRSAIITKKFYNYYNQLPIICASFCRYLRIEKSKFNPFFVYYMLQALYNAGYMSIFNIQHTGVSRFQYTSFKKHVELTFPPLSIQKKIAAILSAYDELIENNNRRIAILEKMAEEIYREWFVRMRFPGHEKVKVVKGVAEGWQVKKIGDVYRTSSGGTPSRSDINNYGGNINWLKTGELKATYILKSEEKITQKGLESSSAKLFPSGTVVMAMYCAMEDISILAIDAATNQACCGFFPKLDYLSSVFTYYHIKFALPHIIAFAHGAAQQNLSQNLIKGYNIFLPTRVLISNYSNIVDPIHNEIKYIIETITSLKQSRDLLLPRLISGKLDIEKLDIVFPPGMSNTDPIEGKEVEAA